MPRCALLAAAALAACSSTHAVPLAPVVIVPGTAGSQLEAKLDKPSSPHFYCQKKSDWYTIWLAVTQLVPPVINCWCDNIRLLWDKETNTYTNNVGVTTRVPGWGSTNGFEYLDPDLKVGQSSYFHDLVESLVNAGGTRNGTIRGSPYDFRLAPTHAYEGSWLDMMTTLVEEAYTANGNQRVTVLSHSMGCLYSLWFLNHKPTEWKAKYIRRWVPTAGVFGGAGTGIKQLLSGSNEGIPGVKGLTVREEQRSYETSMLLAPSVQAYGDEQLVFTPTRNYSAADFEPLFAAANFENGFIRYQLVDKDVNVAALKHPGVDVVHMYGTGKDTPTRYEYPNGFDEEPKTINGDGDGTVPIQSLKSAEAAWANVDGFSFTKYEFPGRDHQSILHDVEYAAKLTAMLAPEV